MCSVRGSVQLLMCLSLVIQSAISNIFEHQFVFSNPGATFLQSLSEKFWALYDAGHPYGDGKEIDNLVILLCSLYNFKVNSFVCSFVQRTWVCAIAYVSVLGHSISHK